MINTARDGHLSPLFKWAGGKRREIKDFKNFLPDFITSGEKYTFVEPFVGGGAVYWYLNNVNGKNIINDTSSDVINFYNCMKNNDQTMLKEVQGMAELFVSKEQVQKREEKYYSLRNLDRSENGLMSLTPGERAGRFYIVNQLAFSGMRRFNSKGQFNVPYGHYSAFDAKLLQSVAHRKLLKKTKILNGDYRKALVGNDKENTFIFLDPPTTATVKTYSKEGEFTKEEQVKLRNRLVTLKKAKWLLIIEDTPLTRKLYKDYIVGEYDTNSGINLKNRVLNKTKHLVACNY